jgi:hypothetical protein
MRSRRRSYSFQRASRIPRAIVGWRPPPRLFERFNFLIGSFYFSAPGDYFAVRSRREFVAVAPVINNLHTGARPFGAARPAFSQYIPIDLEKLERDRDRSND